MQGSPDFATIRTFINATAGNELTTTASSDRRLAKASRGSEPEIRSSPHVHSDPFIVSRQLTDDINLPEVGRVSTPQLQAASYNRSAIPLPISSPLANFRAGHVGSGKVMQPRRTPFEHLHLGLLSSSPCPSVSSSENILSPEMSTSVALRPWRSRPVR
jgi:hypothetical protein